MRLRLGIFRCSLLHISDYANCILHFLSLFMIAEPGCELFNVRLFHGGKFDNQFKA